MARAAEQGLWQPTLITLLISLVLAVWGFYAFSAAGLLHPMPLSRSALAGIGLVYLARGVLFVPLKAVFPDNSPVFWFWSSTLCTAIGLCYLIGLWQSWTRLGVCG